MREQTVKQKNWLYVVIAFLLVVIGVLYFFYEIFLKPRVQFSGKVEPVVVGIVGDTSSLILIAEEFGFFSEQGLAVEIKRYSAGAGAVEDLVAGNIDVAIGSEYVGARNLFFADNFKIIGTVAKTSAYEVVARADHGITTPQDIKGKKIGVTKGTAGDFWLSVFLTTNEISSDEVEVIDMRPPALTDALVSGEIDAMLNLEPHRYNSKQELAENSVSFYGQRGQGVYSVVYASEDLIQNRVGVVLRLLKALAAADTFMTNHADEAFAYIADYFEYSADYIQQVVQKNYDFGLQLEQSLILTMEDEARWMISEDLVMSEQVPNYLEHIYSTPLREIDEDSVTVFE